MGSSGTLAAGSRNRNEFVLIRAEDAVRLRSVPDLSGQRCHICGDEIPPIVNGQGKEEPFIACNECAFPVCQVCYTYERDEGTQACPQCRTRYKRLKGFPRVFGDEEEDGADDIYKEFNYHENGQVNASNGKKSILLLANGEEVSEVSSDHRAIIIPSYLGHDGGQDHPISSESSFSIQLRPINPDRDITLYGYGSILWRHMVDEWKRQQQNELQSSELESGVVGCYNVHEMEPISDESRQPLSRK